MSEQNDGVKAAAREPDMIEKLLRIWDSSVRSTHDFLSEGDIRSIRPEVAEGLQEIPELYCYFEAEEPLGFIGIADSKIEMLFVDAKAQGAGIGKKMIEYVRDNSSIHLVDVNGQNPQALAFYEHLGFKVIGRSALDDAGRAFPILHLSINS